MWMAALSINRSLKEVEALMNSKYNHTAIL